MFMITLTIIQLLVNYFIICILVFWFNLQHKNNLKKNHVINVVMVKKKDLHNNKIKDYGEFFRCKRCVFEMTKDDFGKTKMGKQYITCKTCREKEKEYRKSKPNKVKEKTTIEPTSSTRTRRGGSCLKDIYKTFLIYRTCMRRAPAKPVRACTLRKLCPASHVTCEAPLRTSHSTLHTSHCTLRTPHFTLHTALFALQTSLHTSHFSLLTPHFTLHTLHSTLHTSHCFLQTPHFIPHTLHVTVHTSHFSLLSSHSPHFFTPQRSFYTQQAFTHSKHLHTEHLHIVLLHMASAYTHTHRNFYTEKLLHTANFYTQNFYTKQAFTHSKRLHTVLAHSAFTHGKRLHTEHLHTVLLHMASVYTHTPKKNFYTETLLTHAQISFYTQQTFTRNIFYTQQTFTHSKRLDTEHLHTVLAHSAFTHGKRLHTNFSTQELQLQNRISTRKQKKDDFEAFLKGILKGKLAPKLRKSADKSLSQPGCSHSNTIYNLQLQKTRVLRMQPRHQATLTEPLQCDLQWLSCKTQ